MATRKSNLTLMFLLALVFASVAFAATEVSPTPVKAPTQYTGEIATSSVTLLSSMASFTYPCVIQIQCNNTVFYSAATTTASVVAKGQRLSSFDTLWVSPNQATYNLGFIASSTSAASFSILVHPEAR